MIALEKENLVPLMKRVTDAGIETFTFWDLGEMLALEHELGFTMGNEQVKSWLAKREANRK